MITSKKAHSLQAIKPHLAQLWHPTKNGALKPDRIGFGSYKLCWWLGPCGHEWQAKPDYLEDTSKCPFCYGTEVLTGFNDLETLNPELAKQWDIARNEISPAEVTLKSSRDVWWVCNRGHEWRATVARRVANNTGCPYCSKQKLLPGFNDLATMHPEIAKEWHPVLNGYLQPWEVMDGSKLDIWWMCNKGHEWEVNINTRTNLHSGCPICNKSKPHSAKTISEIPELMDEWHPTKNENLDPTAVRAGAHIPVWWICSKGHEWCVPPHGRRGGRGCPVCAGKVVLEGYNDLASQFPNIAGEWHPTKNGDLQPNQILAGSKNKCWWICNKGHEWQAIISSRTKMNTGCPVCFKASRKYTIEG